MNGWLWEQNSHTSDNIFVPVELVVYVQLCDLSEFVLLQMWYQG